MRGTCMHLPVLLQVLQYGTGGLPKLHEGVEEYG